MKKRYFWTQVWQYTKDFKKNIAITVAGSLAAGVCVALQPLIIKYIVDEGITNTGIGPARQMTAVCIFCGIYLLCSLGRIGFWAVGYRQVLVTVQGFLYNRLLPAYSVAAGRILQRSLLRRVIQLYCGIPHFQYFQLFTDVYHQYSLPAGFSGNFLKRPDLL